MPKISDCQELEQMIKPPQMTRSFVRSTFPNKAKSHSLNQSFPAFFSDRVSHGSAEARLDEKFKMIDMKVLRNISAQNLSVILLKRTDQDR